VPATNQHHHHQQQQQCQTNAWSHVAQPVGGSLYHPSMMTVDPTAATNSASVSSQQEELARLCARLEEQQRETAAAVMTAARARAAAAAANHHHQSALLGNNNNGLNSFTNPYSYSSASLGGCAPTPPPQPGHFPQNSDVPCSDASTAVNVANLSRALLMGMYSSMQCPQLVQIPGASKWGDAQQQGGQKRKRQSQEQSEKTKTRTGRWSPGEHERFLAGLRVHGAKNWRAVAKLVRTRTVVQVRTHAQKFAVKMTKQSSYGGAEREMEDALKVAAGKAKGGGSSSSATASDTTEEEDDEEEEDGVDGLLSLAEH
jgi:SHAQKYF class myb-like DNA-binding protein